jgi:hypothetical protein
MPKIDNKRCHDNRQGRHTGANHRYGNKLSASSEYNQRHKSDRKRVQACLLAQNAQRHTDG